ETNREIGAACAAQDSFVTAQRKSFSELDFVSEDGAVVFRASEIAEMAQDFSAIRDVRAQIRQACRAAQDTGVPPQERRRAIRHSLRSFNEKQAVLKQERAELHALKLKREAEREARGERRRNGSGGPPIA